MGVSRLVLAFGLHRTYPRCPRAIRHQPIIAEDELPFSRAPDGDGDHLQPIRRRYCHDWLGVGQLADL